MFKLKSSSRNGEGIFSTTTRKRVKPPWLFVKLMVRGGGKGGGEKGRGIGEVVGGGGGSGGGGEREGYW